MMRELETDPGWAQRLKDRRMQRHGNERIVRWIATPATHKRRIGGRSLDEPSADNVVAFGMRVAG